MRQKIHWGNPHERSYPLLHGEHEAELVIVGAGIAGIMAAHYAIRAGIRSVVVLEQDAIGSGSTGYSAGMLVSEIETASWKSLVRSVGATHAALYQRAQYKALKDIHGLIKKYRIPCEAQLDDVLFVGSKHRDKKVLDSEFKAKRAMGVYAQPIADNVFDSELSLPPYRFGYRFGTGLSVNPLVCLRGIARALTESGRVRIFEGSPVVGRKGTTLHTQSGTVRAQYVIYACGAWTDDAHVERVITSIAITEPIQKRDLRHAKLLDRDMLIDTGLRSYHYVKATKKSELLLGYGDVYTESSHIDSVHKPHKRALNRYLKTLFPLKRIHTSHCWSQVYALSSGYLPYVRIRKTHAIIAGAGTQVASAVAAHYVVSQIRKRRHPLSRLFS